MLPSGRLALIALSGLPMIRPKDDLAARIVDALTATGEALRPGDVVVVTSKLVSRAEGRFVDLSAVVPSPEGRAIARQVDQDPRLVTLILKETVHISRKARGALIVQNHLGAVCANAGIDRSNAAPVDAPPGSGPWVLLLPVAPDQSAQKIRQGLLERTGVAVGVVLSDSFGRPFRTGTVGVALGLSGLPAVLDQRGALDLFGRPLEHTVTALADQIAAAADLVAGQAAEGRGVVLVRGLELAPVEDSGSHQLLRAPEADLYR